MLPIRDYNPVSKPSVVVPALIVINIAIFLFVQPTVRNLGQPSGVKNERVLEFFVCKASIPYEVTHGKRLADSPATSLDEEGRAFASFQREVCPRKNVWLSVLTSMFLHAGFLHIAGNMLFLFIFGNNVEDRLGRARFLIFYLLCGLAAAGAQSAVNPSSAVPMIGASGAIAGVLGAYLLMFPRARVRTLVFFFFITVFDLPAVFVLGAWFALQLLNGVGSVSGNAGGVAYMAHVGGFVAGLVLLAIMRPRREVTPPFQA